MNLNLHALVEHRKPKQSNKLTGFALFKKALLALAAAFFLIVVTFRMEYLYSRATRINIEMLWLRYVVFLLLWWQVWLYQHLTLAKPLSALRAGGATLISMVIWEILVLVALRIFGASALKPEWGTLMLVAVGAVVVALVFKKMLGLSLKHSYLIAAGSVLGLLPLLTLLMAFNEYLLS